MRKSWVLAAAVLLVAGGVGAALTNGGDEAEPPAVAPTPTARSVPAAEVPWADLPGGPVTAASPYPVATADPTVAVCRADQLRATHDGNQDGAGGSILDAFTLTSTSAVPCRLTGVLDGLTGVRSGRRQPLPLRVQTARPEVDPVVLRTGEQGYVPFQYHRSCDTSTPPDTTYAGLRLELLGGTLDVQGTPAQTRLTLGCAAESGGLVGGQLGGRLAERRFSYPAITQVRNRILAPATVQAGTVLRYVVELENRTPEPMALEPCPSFAHGLGARGRITHRLNCAAAHPVPVGGTETFAMELTVPRTQPSGRTTLIWSITGSSQQVATTEIVVLGGTDPTSGFQACTVDHAKEVPCADGMVVGTRYRYLLHTHCGLQYLHADGRWWVADQPLPEADSPRFYRRDDDPGAVLLRAEDQLDYVTSTNARVPMAPFTGSPPGCD